MSVSLRVLVAAGDDLTRTSTARMLRACTTGDVLEASSGSQALDAMLNGEALDVLLLDCQLAEVSAAETCRRVREQQGLPQPDILVLATGRSHMQVIEALEAGADDFLPLPVAPHLLQARLRFTLRRRQRARAASSFLEALLAAQAEGSGELVVRETKSQRTGRVYFHRGQVVWVHVAGKTSTLEEVLTGVASIDARTASEVLEECRNGRARLSQTLERWGILDRSRWSSCLQAWLKERLQTLAGFVQPIATFLPQEFRYADDISFALSDLMGVIDAREAIEPMASERHVGWATALVPPPAPDPHVDLLLGACMKSGLVQSVAVLERKTGRCLGARGKVMDPLEAWSNLHHVNTLSESDGLDAFAVTTKSDHYLTVPVSEQPDWLVYASYSRDRGPLGVALTDLRAGLAHSRRRAK